MRLRLPSVLQSYMDDYLESPCERDAIPAYGGDISSKSDGAFRIGTQNINGLHIESVYTGSEEIDAMENLGIDILGLSEINTKLSSESRTKLNAMMTLQFGHGITTVSSSKDRDEGYLPGGTAMLARGRVAGRVTKRVGDDLGRYSYMALRGRDDTGVIIINLYRVCQNKGTRAGPDTAYMQQI